jgi:hypothetical protein
VNDIMSASERRLPASPRHRVPGRLAGSTARAVVYCLVLVPLGVASLVVAPFGGAQRVAGWWRGLRTGLLCQPSVPPRRPAGLAVLGHALASVLLGVAALPALGAQVLMVRRGLLYGMFDRGPYDTSWGGPSRAGAWFAHFLVGLPFTALGLVALAGIAALHQRLTQALDSGRLARWVIPTTLLLSLLAVILFVAWTRQM